MEEKPKNLRIFLLCFIPIALIAVAVFAYQNFQPRVGSFSPTGGGTYLLQSSISSSQTSITLTSFTEPSSGIPYTMSYLGTDIIYGTIAPSSGNSEFVSATGITQNGNGTATLTGVTRGLARTPAPSGCVGSTTLAHAFPGQTQFILSNSPCFYSEYALRRSTQTISGRWIYETYPEATSTIGNATTSLQFITLGQASALANQGAATATEAIAGISKLGTAAQQGSSTWNGVDDPTVLQTRYATDTPTYGCNASFTGVAGAGCTVIAQLTGKIKQTWLALSEAFAFGSTVSIAATTTASSGFVLPASAAAPLTFGSTATSWSFSGTAANHVFRITGGAGTGASPFTVATGYPDDYVIEINGNANQSTSATATTSLKTITLPANIMTTATQLRVTALYTQTGNNAACYGGLNYGDGGGVATTSVGFTKMNGQSQGGFMEVTIYATTTSAQGAVNRGTTNIPTGFASATTFSGITYPIVPTTAASFLSLNAICGSASDSVKLVSYTVERLSRNP